MDKETIKFLWEIYNDLLKQKDMRLGEDYPLYNIDPTINKLKDKIDDLLK